MLHQIFRHCSQFICALSGVGVMLPVLTGCSPNSSNAEDAAPPLIRAVPVVSKGVHLWDEFNGRVEAIQHVLILARISGYIEKVDFSEGQLVKKGDVLFTIDPKDYQASLQRASADLARMRARAKLTASEAERARKLVEQQAISTEMWEQRQSAAAQALADVRSAEAVVTQARLDLERTQVRSPINGHAGRANFTEGNLVAAGDSTKPLTSVVSRDKVFVYFDVDEAVYRRYLQAGRGTDSSKTLQARVGLVGESGYPHSGGVDFFDNQVSRSTGTITARAVMDNSSGQFTPGMFARVQLRADDQIQALIVDQKAILTDQDRKYVFVVDEDSKAQRRDVKLGAIAEGQRIITEGLREGDYVVTGGAQRIIVPGSRVRVEASDAVVKTSGI